MTDREIDRLRTENELLADRLDRLSKRKSVRAALRLANVAGRLRGHNQRGEMAGAMAREIVGGEPIPQLDDDPAAVPDDDQQPLSVVDGPGSEHRHLPASTIDLLRMAPPVSVLVPVYNAFEEFSTCVESLFASTSTANCIVFIDDASTDDRVTTLLADLADLPDVTVLTNAENLGFVRTVNRGFDHISGDVILLNADTMVGPRWVERLRFAAYAEPQAASVTAFSDNAGAFSAPVPNVSNPEAARWGADAAARLVGRHSQRILPSTPTASGFCMYVKRRALDDVGGFDEVKYPRGYGEENDWSMRAQELGWSHLVDDSSYVMHTRSASFGDEKIALARDGRERLRQDWPSYGQLVKEFSASDDMDRARAAVGRALDRASGPVLPRVLYTLHNQGGGTPATSYDLARAITVHYEALILRAHPTHLEVTDKSGSVHASSPLRQPLRLDPPTSRDYRDGVARLLIDLDVEMVHIRHLMHHSLELPSISQQLGIPVMLSVHDFYLVCPTAHLLDERGRFCRGTCTTGQGTCPSVEWVAAGPHLKHAWVKVWQRHTAEMLEHVDLMIAANEATRDLFCEMLPAAGEKTWEVVEHGRDLVRSDASSSPADSEPIRILLAGHMWAHKGAELLRSLIEADIEKRLEFHVLGTMPPLDGVVVHGRYDRSEFASRVKEIRPAAMAMLSTTAETYSHTMTEGWSVGLPIIATDLGAPAHRIRRQGGGWLIDHDDPSAAYRQIVSWLTDPNEYGARRAEAARATWPSVDVMASRYAQLYDRLRGGRRTIAT